jgi:hypothetical protein
MKTIVLDLSYHLHPVPCLKALAIMFLHLVLHAHA